MHSQLDTRHARDTVSSCPPQEYPLHLRPGNHHAHHGRGHRLARSPNSTHWENSPLMCSWNV